MYKTFVQSSKQFALVLKTKDLGNKLKVGCKDLQSSRNAFHLLTATTTTTGAQLTLRSLSLSFFFRSDLVHISYLDLGGPFFPGGPELWHHPLAYSAAAAAELPGAAALQHATLVHPALHPQVPVRSYL